MKKRIFGIVFAVLGLLLALGPQFLFKVCQPMGEMIMRCYWAARAEIGVGAVIAVLGIALIVFTCSKVRLGLVIGIFLSGINALLIPHAIIGGCAMHTMPCREIAFPAITVISILLLIGTGIYIFVLSTRKEK
jgi:hypothetical protein